MKSVMILLALVAVACASIVAPANNAHYTTWAAVAEEGAVVERASQFCVSFKAQGSNDAHIVLSSKAGVERAERAYEIVIGGWSNTKSVIRVGTQGTVKETFPLNPYMSGDLMSAKEARPLWISLVDGELSVGTGKTCYQNIFMTSTFVIGSANKFLDIKHIAFGAWDTPVEFSDIDMHVAESDWKEFTVPGNGRIYKVFNRPNDITVSADSFELVFQARGDAATIGLLPDYVKSTSRAFEFVLDANNGTATEIWKGTRAHGNAKLLTRENTRDLIHPHEYKNFWIRKYGDAVAIGQGPKVGQRTLAVANVEDLGLDEFVIGWAARDYPTSFRMISSSSEDMLDDDEVEKNLHDYFDAITESQMETAMIKGGSGFQSKLYEEWQKETGDKQLDSTDEKSWIELQYKLAAQGNPTAIAIMKGTYPKPTPPKETAAEWETSNYLELEGVKR